ncbi:hypothetical protein [Anaeromassilibacillus senegalensis]|uniref:hypothetical protein n=1 Tax=Anaeromassilibacillus senegalensis TaxID=1673717 RepID=UPI000682B2FC|nr:hypothetical protein [Anaeromassilibacillus senegalensis]
MRYSDLVEVSQGFQASVNLEYDLNKTGKIRGYIPTEQSTKVLGAFLRSYYYNTESHSRATVLIGPYGRGKSHLLLVLSALTSLDLRAHNEREKKNARKIQNDLCEKIERVDAETGALARAIVTSEIRTLPVIINSNSTDINQSFLVAINDALLQAGLQDLLPNTYFDSAVAVIDKWEASFPDAFAKLKEELRKSKISAEELRIGLKQFRQKSYRLFCKCYPRIAAGTEFNPLTNMDVVKLYIAVSNALCEQTAYCGISIIFDEFSKFLEANLEKSKMLNFKIIQDMAEAATRSKEAQLHFTCITHKDILDYSSSDSFKTVEGRFRTLRFVASSERSYELIANAIIKKNSFAAFQKEHAKDFKYVADISARTTLFTDLSQDTYREKLVSGCFPLSPLGSFALLHVSELVGQNERTLFTFLAQNDQYTFKSFIGREVDKLQWITVDYIYGYFEELFKKEVFNTTIHSIWAKVNSAIRQVTDLAQLSILKAIAIINIIGDERLKPVPAHIKAALLMDDAVFDNAIRALLKMHILSQRDSSEYVLLTANGVDVQRSVDNYAKSSLTKLNICETLTHACDLGFVMPREYNDKYSMLRCFKNIYMDANALMQCKNGNQLLIDYPYDGLIINVVSLDDTVIDKVIKKIRTFSNTPQIVVCVSDQPFVYEGILKQYVAVRKLLEINEDPHFVEELEIFKEDIQKRIQNAVYTMYSPSSEHSSFWTHKGRVEVSRQVELNHEISDICSKCYNKTPVVNNEMVNKCKLNSQNAKAREIVVSWIFQHAEDNAIPCMEGSGPEVSIFKSAFKQTGLDVSAIVRDPGMNAVLAKIGEFICGCEQNRSNFQTIYQTLTSAPYGMRKGIIPLYIAYVMRQYKESIVLYFKGKEIELSASVLSSMNDSPESYELLIETGTANKDQYLDELQALFEKYTDVRTQSINRIYSIIKSMQNWMRSLPEYTKKFKCYLDNGENKTIAPSVDVIRSELMRFEINSRELLFGTWLTKLSQNEDVNECFGAICAAKEQLDNHLAVYKAELIKKLTAMFIPGYQGGLSRSIISWYQKLPDTTKTHVFDASANVLMTSAGALTSYNDYELLDELISIFVAIAIEDWNDTLADTFIKNISDAINRINEYADSKTNEEQAGRLLITTDGIQVEKTFNAEMISPLGETVLSNLRAVFDEYNDSVEPDEQLAILAKLIREIIH